MPWIELTPVLALTAGTTIALILSLWLISIPLRDISIIDMAFSAMIAILLLAAYRASGAQGIIPDGAGPWPNEFGPTWGGAVVRAE